MRRRDSLKTENGTGKYFILSSSPIRALLCPNPFQTRLIDCFPHRERYGKSNPSISEITVSKVQTYYLMNDYLSKLTNTPMRTLEDIVKYNNTNRGSEGGHPSDIPAFPDGQPLFEDCVKTKGIKTPEYHAALKHITSQCRENGIDAALRLNRHRDFSASRDETLDALLFCDVKRSGIQIAAQAGYPVITIPVSLDPDGMPVSLVLIHSKWQDGTLVKWASAIEDLFREITKKSVLRRVGNERTERKKRIGRIPPTYMNHLRKNVPVEAAYRYEGAKNPQVGSFQDSDMQPAEGRRHESVEDEELEDWERPRYLV